jgi:hypothetical protein
MFIPRRFVHVYGLQATNDTFVADISSDMYRVKVYKMSIMVIWYRVRVVEMAKL